MKLFLVFHSLDVTLFGKEQQLNASECKKKCNYMTYPASKTLSHFPSWEIFTDSLLSLSSCLTLKLFEPPLQLVVVESRLA